MFIRHDFDHETHEYVHETYGYIDEICESILEK